MKMAQRKLQSQDVIEWLNDNPFYRFRKSYNLSLRQMCDLMGINHVAYHYYETGQRMPREDKWPFIEQQLKFNKREYQIWLKLRPNQEI